LKTDPKEGKPDGMPPQLSRIKEQRTLSLSVHKKKLERVTASVHPKMRALSVISPFSLRQPYNTLITARFECSIESKRRKKLKLS
jgi:flagellar assembly factor FliW